MQSDIDYAIAEASYNLTKPEYIDTAEGAKLIRKALKLAFPAVKFSVRIERYSGGSATNITWTDGPSPKRVEAITSQFQGGRFDGMIDLAYSVNHWLSPEGTLTVLASSPGTGGSKGSDPAAYGDRPGLDWRLVRFSCNHVHASRRISDFDMQAKVAELMLRRYYGVAAGAIALPSGEWITDVANRIVHARNEGETMEHALTRTMDRWGGDAE